MRLAEFVLARMEEILAEFEAFARTVLPGETMDVAALRDHAKEMLKVIARDLNTPQTERERSDKSKGLADSPAAEHDTPAQEHGSGRAESGFTVEQMVSEYRALRASVIRLWSAEKSELTASDVDDLIRFSEAIDQALAESTSRFMQDLDQTRERFLGILGHDLRSPLGAILTSGKFMQAEEQLTPTARKLTDAIVRSGCRMNDMVDDLLEFTRSRLGASVPIERADADLRKIVTESIDEMKAAYPEADIRLEADGDFRGQWDSGRLSQVLSNLLSNAINHGVADRPVTVSLSAAENEVALSVHNYGRRIPKDEFRRIFDPMRRLPSESRNPGNLGLGLFIVERIVTAHGGSINVDSTEGDGTKFTVRLPRSGSDLL